MTEEGDPGPPDPLCEDPPEEAPEEQPEWLTAGDPWFAAFAAAAAASRCFLSKTNSCNRCLTSEEAMALCSCFSFFFKDSSLSCCTWSNRSFSFCWWIHCSFSCSSWDDNCFLCASMNWKSSRWWWECVVVCSWRWRWWCWRKEVIGMQEEERTPEGGDEGSYRSTSIEGEDSMMMFVVFDTDDTSGKRGKEKQGKLSLYQTTMFKLILRHEFTFKRRWK